MSSIAFIAYDSGDGQLKREATKGKGSFIIGMKRPMAFAIVRISDRLEINQGK